MGLVYGFEEAGLLFLVYGFGFMVWFTALPNPERPGAGDLVSGSRFVSSVLGAL